MGEGFGQNLQNGTKFGFANSVYSVEKSIRVYSCSFVINGESQLLTYAQTGTHVHS
jgi:hypothetical protein